MKSYDELHTHVGPVKKCEISMTRQFCISARPETSMSTSVRSGKNTKVSIQLLDQRRLPFRGFDSESTHNNAVCRNSLNWK